MIPKVCRGFRKRSCSNKKLERDDDSKKSHPALDRALPGSIAGSRSAIVSYRRNRASEGVKMAVLVTRPQPDGEATAKSLRAKGFEVLLAPMLRFEPVPFHDDDDASYGAVILTSANALRAIEPQLGGSRLLKLPLFAVGEHTAAAARDAGFGEVIAAEGGDAGALRELVLSSVKTKRLRKTATLLYLAGADLARDLAGELGEKGFTVITHTTYRMVPASELPREVCDAFVAGEV